MTKRKPKDLNASIQARLLKIHRETGEDHTFLLIRYALERFLYRLGCSKHSEAFVLKGAMLFAVWTGKLHRPTKDLDLLGMGELSEERLKRIFEDICNSERDPDGLHFEPSSISVEDIREEQEYQGKRVRFLVYLGNAKVRLQVDIGFGDAITPHPEVTEYPTILDLPAPKLRAYPRETVVAEKVEAMVDLGMDNSRMKDFYDLWVLARSFPFKGSLLCSAVRATFERRKTDLPQEIPVALTESFTADQRKNSQWKAFVDKGKLGNTTLEEVIPYLRGFLWPPLEALANKNQFPYEWNPRGNWKK